ncbi:hypothetical protein V7266_30575, partial [Neobacillus drentensis]|uniref:hypothetical protein n=1 Tax=Neobacillus drentensis TaxID=220684 RepID=UPI002FFFC86D
MKNSSADELISHCEQEIKLIKEKIQSLDKFDQSRDFITKYALIRVSGIIEYAIKTIIADKCEENASQQVKNFIENKIRMNSSNPTINT